ncbi:bifunctional adenosylcobinamide kinase/adenosylcobinamide-phosphate guanylyltransferase [Clostridium sp. CM028]|uniref:bifunctional adenosylcobinamide kinase/adenosylcobinamide-phosphate guanylyltransferase n=1 Tax=Clostridium TaxID=1485 RepID=UPI0013EEB14C|nr:MULTISPECIES: bifunctional adenosylcobinamide kinase/adenosylcobinamide-phosphate guanylyltransferase [Clostridium]MBU3092921.1 bifunctional adenosylcobinamide kinase/adenosylcobinamide-phosphate guanylyltransferase [Clostridium sp. CF011]MBW9149955.1 bifunctional adenosylcobinamide kinase/adenosylcobinamide-phosphate guanylyltransferase [Clostridium sp. CM028]MBZ9607620.1 bifunctional adenosylcobinamide kinase/adenosylcobinamide-phosphate guanylyltransferase [Clostridium estertheticum]WAG70
MKKIILITGGARSGKSTYAEKLAKEEKGNVLYIATSIPFDDEMKDRVKKHKERRPANWYTFEGYKNLKQVFYNEEMQFDTILLDCITIMTTNLMFDEAGDNFDDLNNQAISAMEKGILQEVAVFLDEAEKNLKTIILVTNEIGSGIVPEYKMARVFRDIAGRVNQYIASRAQEVHMVVCGIPIKIK